MSCRTWAAGRIVRRRNPDRGSRGKRSVRNGSSPWRTCAASGRPSGSSASGVPRPGCNLSRSPRYLRVMSVNDEALMSAVREGDLAQLGPLFDRYHVPLFDFLSRMTGNRQVSEDLVQEVFLRVLKYRGTYREGARFGTWIFSIARNVRTDYFSRRELAVPLSDEVL